MKNPRLPTALTNIYCNLYQTSKKETFYIENVSELDKITDKITEFREMIVLVDLICRQQDESKMYNIIENRRGKPLSTDKISDTQIRIKSELPMSEVIDGFNQEIKSITRGYGSFQISFKEFRKEDIKLLTLEIMSEEVEAFKFLVHKKRAAELGKKVTAAFRQYIEKHLFQVSIRAKVGGKIVASEIIKPRGKNVLAKCYGGDFTRKRKLIEAQKEGKAKMKEFGRVHVKTSNINKIFKALARDRRT